MTIPLEIAITREALESGGREERAGYGLLSILAQGAYLTEGIDHYIRGYRVGPLVSGYPLAEWFAWHWWRQRWEPRRADINWSLAHCMTAVGESYVWPNITILSDGVRVALVAKPSAAPDAKPFRYTRDWAVTLPASAWEGAVDGFLQQILALLNADGVKDTNLHRLTDDLSAERSDPELARWRRLEAMLGREPDTLDEAFIQQLIAESEQLGAAAIDEMAAATKAQATPTWLSAAALAEFAREQGFRLSPRDGVEIKPPPMNTGQPAWQWGTAVARQVRRQARLEEGLIDDKRLADMAGVSAVSLESAQRTAASHPAFALEQTPQDSWVAFRSAGKTGRRFELARLLGDRILQPGNKLHPATRADTYRQKAQRAFAAELLMPADTAIAQLDERFDDEEHREDLSARFGVSPRVIENHLANHGLLPREAPDDPDIMANAA